MPSEIGFPTLTSDASLNQKTINKLAMNKRKALDSCTSSGKRQLKTSQVDTRPFPIALVKS